MNFLRDDSPPNARDTTPSDFHKHPSPHDHRNTPDIPSLQRKPHLALTTSTKQHSKWPNFSTTQKHKRFRVSSPVSPAQQKPFQSFHQLFPAGKPGQQLPLVAVLHHVGHLTNTRTRINSLHSSTASFRNKNRKMDTWISTFLLSYFHFSPTSSSFDKNAAKAHPAHATHRTELSR